MSNGKRPRDETCESAFMRLEEVLDMVGMSRSSFYRLIGTGKVPRPIKPGARTCYWKRGDIEALRDHLVGVRPIGNRTKHEQPGLFGAVFDPSPAAPIFDPRRGPAGTEKITGELVFRFGERFYRLRAEQEAVAARTQAHSRHPLPQRRTRNLRSPDDTLHFSRVPDRYRTLDLPLASDTTRRENRVLRFSAAFHRGRAELIRRMRPVRASEAAALLRVTPTEFRRQIAAGRYPLPYRLKKGVYRWPYAEIKHLSGLATTDLDFKLTQDETQDRRLQRRRTKDERLARIIANRNDEPGRRAMAGRISRILAEQFTPGGLSLITIYFPRSVHSRDDLGSFDIGTALAFTRRLLREIGLGTVKAIGAFDIVQIARTGWHKNLLPTWHPHLHLVLDTRNITPAMKTRATRLLSEQGSGGRLFHCVPIEVEPFNTGYLLKSPNRMGRRLKPKGRPLSQDTFPLVGRDRIALLDLLGRVAITDFVYAQNVDLPSDWACGLGGRGPIDPRATMVGHTGTSEEGKERDTTTTDM